MVAVATIICLVHALYAPIFRYCQNLPKPDKFTVLAPEFTEKASEGFCKFDVKWYSALYTTYIRLPMSSPVREANVS